MKSLGGGTGYDLENKLPDEIEHIYPDYSLYGVEDKAYGFLTRGCPRACPFCIVSAKEGRKSAHVADLDEFYRGQKEIELLDPNLLACQDSEKLLKELSGAKSWVNFSQGLDARLLTKENIELLNNIKTKNIHFAWDFMEQSDKVIDGLRKYSKWGAFKGAGVYVLTNFNTTHDEDMERVVTLRTLGFKPYVMVYDKPTASAITKKLQSWVNNRIAFNICEFDEFSYQERKLKRKKQK